MKLVRLAPNIEKHFIDQVLGYRVFTHETQDEPVDANVMAYEQHLHREPVARGDSADQFLIRRRLDRRPDPCPDKSRERRKGSRRTM